MEFTCPQHRQWLQQHPNHARRHLQQCLEHGEICLQDQQLSEATANFGAAVDCAHILLTAEGLSQPLLIDFTHASLCLFKVCYLRGDLRLALHSLDTCDRTLCLQLALCNPSLRHLLQDCIASVQMVKNSASRLGVCGENDSTARLH